MIGWISAFSLGLGVGVILSSLKDWMLIRELLDRITFKNPSDYFYAQHMRKDEKSTMDRIKEYLPLKKKPVAVNVVPPSMVQEDMQKQVEKQELDEQETEKHRKLYEVQRKVQIAQGDA